MKTVSELAGKEFRGRKLQAAMAVDQRLFQGEQKPDKEKKDGESEEDDGDENEESEDADEQDEEQEDEEKTGAKEETHNGNGHKKAEAKPRSQEEKDRGIVFVKNVDFDINEADFTEHFKAFGRIVWAKLVKRDENSHRGTGFVKFRDEADSQRLVEMSKELKAKPDEKVLIDPLNVLEIRNRQIEVLPALSKEDLPKHEAPVKVNVNKKKLKLETLIAMDYKNNRNFKLATEGFAVSEQNVEGKDAAETDKRRRHLVR